ncbi:MAG: hypothetical protein OQL16_00485 [Gammaproteobacteria bacterium]|nr:hypothetical protein [Gammaproteobacteria bacterium]
MILYIHGFASCGAGNKVQFLWQHFGEAQVISPDLPVAPVEAISYLEAIINEKPVKLLIGSSLGGYYADYLGSRYGIPAVLINPSTRPFETLRNYIGTNTNWCSGEPFEWKPGYCDALESIYREAPASDENYLVLLQSADEVLDYRLAETRYQHHKVIVEQGGNHRFENLGDYLSVIDEFINAS